MSFTSFLMGSCSHAHNTAWPPYAALCKALCPQLAKLTLSRDTTQHMCCTSVVCCKTASVYDFFLPGLDCLLLQGQPLAGEAICSSRPSLFDSWKSTRWSTLNWSEICELPKGIVCSTPSCWQFLQKIGQGYTFAAFVQPAKAAKWCARQDQELRWCKSACVQKAWLTFFLDLLLSLIALSSHNFLDDLNVVYRGSAAFCDRSHSHRGTWPPQAASWNGVVSSSVLRSFHVRKHHETWSWNKMHLLQIALGPWFARPRESDAQPKALAEKAKESKCAYTIIYDHIIIHVYALRKCFHDDARKTVIEKLLSDHCTTSRCPCPQIGKFGKEPRNFLGFGFHMFSF